MVNEKELLTAIKECEKTPASYLNCERLANLITVYNHYYGEKHPYHESAYETVVQLDGTSEFMRIIDGKNAQGVWDIIDELMDTVKLLHPRIYDSVLSKIQNLR